MEQVIYFLMEIIRCGIYVMNIFIIIRAVMTWIPGSDDGVLGSFIYTTTEPLVGFVRSIIYKIRPLRDIPIDFSPLFSCILLDIILTFL